MVLYFRIDQAQEAFFHFVGRDEELAELDGRVGALDEAEYTVDVLNDGPVGCHEQAVGVDAGVAFVEVARADAGDV